MQKTTLVAKYGNRDDFLLKFNPSTQKSLCINEDDCYFGDYPTLAKIKAYGANTPVAWLIPQLYNLSEFCGCKEKLQGDPLEECAFVIASNYFYLKVSEFMLFFFRFKAGKYGHFYGSVDPLVITTALREFITERQEAYFRKDQEEMKKKNELEKKNSVSYEEYLEIKRKKHARTV